MFYVCLRLHIHFIHKTCLSPASKLHLQRSTRLSPAWDIMPGSWGRGGRSSQLGLPWLLSL